MGSVLREKFGEVLMGKLGEKLFVFTNGDLMAVEGKGGHVDFRSIDHHVSGGNQNFFTMERAGNIEKKSMVQDKHPKQGKSHGRQGADGYRPSSEDPGPDGLPRCFNFLLSYVDFPNIGELAFEFPGITDCP